MGGLCCPVHCGQIGGRLCFCSLAACEPAARPAAVVNRPRDGGVGSALFAAAAGTLAAVASARRARRTCSCGGGVQRTRPAAACTIVGRAKGCQVLTRVCAGDAALLENSMSVWTAFDVFSLAGPTLLQWNGALSILFRIRKFCTS